MELLDDTSELVCVAAVGDAAAAISEAARCLPDVALLDVMMPGGGGLAAAVGIREVSPRTSDIGLFGRRGPLHRGPDAA